MLERAGGGDPLTILHCVQTEKPRAACLRDLFLQEWAVL